MAQALVLNESIFRGRPLKVSMDGLYPGFGPSIFSAALILTVHRPIGRSEAY